MSLGRHHRFVRVVVTVLLLWTAVDLSNAGLCALDNERAGGASFDAPAATWASAGDTAPLPIPLRHIDDCFCCSHCVDVRALVPATLSTPAVQCDAAATLAGPRIFGSPLYHPPLV